MFKAGLISFYINLTGWLLHPELNLVDGLNPTYESMFGKITMFNGWAIISHDQNLILDG